MAENKIYPWAQSSDANVFSDAEYAADVEAGGIYVGGVQTGLASSKQANKTWRQATAPGSGLGQFLVDNLGVDVTDADTPATFSSRIANAILKLAQISPFNQSWATATGGYRKYAIVSDSSGNFWVSTADQNVTVPGVSGAKWQSLFDGYITETAADDRYVRFIDDTVNWPVQYIGVNKATSAPWFKSGPNYYMLQPAGDYATNSALSGYLKNTNGGIGGEQVGTSLVYQTSAGRPFFSYNNNAAGGNLAWYSDVVAESTARTNADNNLQNQINGKQPAGDYVTGLSADKIMQDFVVAVTGSGVHDIAFPQTFSAPPSTIVISNGLTNGSNSPVSVLGGWTVTGFQIQTNGSTSVNFLAVGPK